MKLKLDKLISKMGSNEQLNDSVLDKARQAMAQDQTDSGNAKLSNSRRKNKFWLGIATAAACVVICIAIALPLTFNKDKPSEPQSFYCYEGDYEWMNYESIAKYNEVNGINLFYFDSDREIERTSHLYRHNNVDALLDERILFLDNYEEIHMYVGRKDYDFEFLKPFQDLSDTVEIGGRTVRFATEFDAETYMYSTRVRWTEGEYRYRILILMENPDTWKNLLNDLFRKTNLLS